MRQTSELYKQLRTQTGSYYEVKIVRGDVTYGMDKLKSIAVEQAMFDGCGPQIGGVYSSQCKVKLIEQSSNWPRAASFEVLTRITNGVQTDDNWLSMGTYYTDERHADKYGNLEIITFDDMLTLEQPWTDKVQDLPSEWPVTAKKACDMISEALGVQYDSRTVLDNAVPFIGLDTTSTARETLSAVAAGMGGNWHITPEGKLRLIPFIAPVEDVRAIVGIAIAGVSKVGDTTIDESDNRRFISLGMKVKDIKVGTAVGSINNVELTTSGGTVALAKHGEGYTLKGKCDFSDSAVAELCLSKVEGYVYKPFEATSARLDPAAELGDLVEIDGEKYPLCSIHWRIGPHITADISAPYEETIDHEYTIASESAKTLRKAMGYTDTVAAHTFSEIKQTETSIMTRVGETYDELDEKFSEYSPTSDIEAKFNEQKKYTDDLNYAAQSSINQTKDSVTVALESLDSINGDVQDIISYIYYGQVNLVKNPQTPDDVSRVTAVVVGKSGQDNKTSVRITNDGIYLCYGDVAVSSWDQNEQLSPKALRVPVGGKLTIGSILYQPRSSGNMSMMWVGQNGN